MKYLIRVSLLVIALFAAASCSTPGTTKGDGSPGSSSSLTAFQATDLSGDPLDLSDHLGRDVILMSFWATWCEPCKAEMPVLQQLHDKYAAEGLKVLSIALDTPETASGVKPYIRTHGYTFTVILDEDTTIAQAYNPKTTAPYSLLIDREGKIAERIEGFQLSEVPVLEAKVKALLAAK